MCGRRQFELHANCLDPLFKWQGAVGIGRKPCLLQNQRQCPLQPNPQEGTTGFHLSVKASEVAWYWSWGAGLPFKLRCLHSIQSLYPCFKCKQTSRMTSREGSYVYSQNDESSLYNLSSASLPLIPFPSFIQFLPKDLATLGIFTFVWPISVFKVLWQSYP